MDGVKMQMQIKEALYELRKQYDIIVSDYEKIILAMDKQLQEYEKRIEQLEGAKKE